MVSVLKKLIDNRNDRLYFIGTVIIATNAGDTWIPIGDFTTIMFWIGGQITPLNIIIKLIIPSLVCLMVPLIILSFNEI